MTFYERNFIIGRTFVAQRQCRMDATVKKKKVAQQQQQQQSVHTF